MAHVEVIQTGSRVITYIRGRVYRQQSGQQKRPEQSLRSRTTPRTKERRRVCLLSVRDAGWLEEHGVNQPCYGPGCTHAHHTRRQIEEMVKKGQLRWVGENHNVAAWTDPREWRGVRGTMQLVPLGSGMSRLQQRGYTQSSAPADTGFFATIG